MVRLIIETPLANDQIRPAVLDHLHHPLKLLLLVLPQLPELLHAADVQMMLGLGTRGLEGAGEDGELGVADNGGHLWVGEVFVDEDTTDEGGVGEGTADLGGDFDEVEGDVAALDVGDLEDGVDGDLGELTVFFRYAVGGKRWIRLMLEMEDGMGWVQDGHFGA